MDAFAIYRLPHTGHCTLVGQCGLPASFRSLHDLGNEPGFVVAPFTCSDTASLLLIRPDVIRRCNPADVVSMNDLTCHLHSADVPVVKDDKEAYHSDFCRFHQAFSATGIKKLVLARSADVMHRGTDPLQLFAIAYERYPEAFVTLFSAPQCGTWLMATPEVLLAREQGTWRTMALAGTMRYADALPSWSDKNVREQAYVAQYISDCLSRFSDDVTMTAPYTTRAGMLVHLRTDFSFTLRTGVPVGHLLDTLHPTPAVCGLPKHEAHRFILDNEHIDRSYYSGFSGPMAVEGDTALFVSLRCMRILDDRYRLFAGGGILPQSEESQEWEETVAKMQAMLSIIKEL